MDNLRIHHAKVVKDGVALRPEPSELHNLPGYSPNLNPYDYLNGGLRSELAKRPEWRIKGKFTKTVRSTMKKLQGSSSTISATSR